jgi:cysteine synthase
MISAAEESGKLRPGGTVVEGTAGNTGIGLAHICLARGYKCVIFMPNTQSQEKIDTLNSLGCDVRPVPVVPYADPMNFNHQAQRHAESLENAVWTDQFDNTANRDGHYQTTGPEIWAQTQGKVDGFVCATGTGGTLAGTGRYLKEKNPNFTLWLADPPGSILYDAFSSGEVGERTAGSITEGIGQGRITANLKDTPIDRAVRIVDEKSINMMFRMLRDEGIPIGASSALNVQAAYELAEALPEDSVVVTMLCDGMGRYASRLLSRQWLDSKNLLSAVPDDCQHFLRDE